MKKIVIMSLLLVNLGVSAQNYNSSWSKQDKQYYKIIGFGFDVRNAVVGSKSTSYEPSLNYQLKVGARANNLEVFMQYEQFKRINYQSYGINVCYVKQLLNGFDGLLGIEGGSIVREGNSNYLFVGGNIILRYNVSDLLAVEFQSNTRLRNDIDKEDKSMRLVRTSGFINLIVKL